MCVCVCVRVHAGVGVCVLSDPRFIQFALGSCERTSSYFKLMCIGMQIISKADNLPIRPSFHG